MLGYATLHHSYILMLPCCAVLVLSMCRSEGSSGEGGCSGRHLFGWRDAMDIVVK